MIKLIPFEELEQVLLLIHLSFSQLVKEYKMTPENCPGNSAFLSKEKLCHLYQNKVVLFGLYDSELIGCVAIEKKSPFRSKIKLLSVLPDHQHKGYGETLMTYAEEHISNLGGEKVQLGMIFENQRLFHWYKSLGFEVEKIKSYKGSAFKVAFMEKKL